MELSCTLSDSKRRHILREPIITILSMEQPRAIKFTAGMEMTISTEITVMTFYMAIQAMML